MRTRWYGGWVLPVFCLLLAGNPVVAGAQSIAMATDVAGKVTAAGQGISILSEIPSDARVELDAGARLVAVYLKSGEEYSFTGPAQIQFRASDPEVLSGAKPQKRGNPLRSSGVRINPVSTTQAGFVMRSGRNTARIKLLALSGTRTLETNPEFRWLEAEPGLKYQFDLTDETGKSLIETRVEGSSFRLPASVQLQADTTYTWEISVRLSDGRRYVNAGDFSIAPPGLRAQANTLRPARDAPVSERVAFAAWLEQMELRDEARKYWRVLAAERPEDERLKALAAD